MTGAISHCTPKDTSNKQNIELQIDTGDSFDDVLEENEENLICATTISTTKNARQNLILIMKLGGKRLKIISHQHK